MPTYNRPRTVGNAVRSVAVQQEDGHELEIVIVDDSTDDTLEVARRALEDFPGCQVVGHRAGNPRLRTNGARNKGIELATGELCILLDSDDEMLPGALTYVRTFFEANAHIDVLFASIESKSGRRPRGDRTLLDREVSYEELASSNVGEFLPIVRRRVFVTSGIRFQPQLIGFEGITWFSLARNGYRYYLTSKPLRLYDDEGTDRTTNARFRLERAAQFSAGHVYEIREFGADVRRRSEWAYQKRLVKAMLYNRLATERDPSSDTFLREANRLVYALVEWTPTAVARRIFDLGVRLFGDT
jgi:glycosyltransferase involved in cell wall biosynthesis